MGRDIEAIVVVDVASVAYAIRDATDGVEHPIDPRLDRLVELIERMSFSVVGLRVALPLAAVDGPGSHRGRAEEFVERRYRWLVAERERVHAWAQRRNRAISLRALPGAFDGYREVAVDVVAALGALDAAADIVRRGRVHDQVVLVVSNDRDLQHLAAYASPVRLFSVGTYDGAARARLRAADIPHVALDPRELVVTVGDAAFPGTPPSRGTLTDEAVLTRRAPGGRVYAVSSPLDRDTQAGRRPPSEPLTESNTVAVVDPYGLAAAAVRAIGLACLPTAATVRALLADFGWPRPIAVYATVPDLRHDLPHDLDPQVWAAWQRRDEELDDLARELDGDRDALTQVRRGVLEPQRQQGRRTRDAVHRAGVEHDPVQRFTKQLSTGLAADLWLAATVAPDAQIVLCSDDCDLAWAQRVFSLVGIPNPDRVTRVGIHAHSSRRVHVYGVADDALDDAAYVILTEGLLAELVGVAAPSGPRLRHLLHEAVARGADWEVDGIDPENGGIVVHAVPAGPEGGPIRPERVVAILSAGALAVGDVIRKLGSCDDGPPTRLDLLFDHRSPCSMPMLQIARPDKERGATVVERTDALLIDFDRDGRVDAAVSPGHDTAAYERGARVTIRRSADHRSWVLADAGVPASAASEPVPAVDIVTVTGLKHGRFVARTADGASGTLLPPPGEGESPLPLGARVFAARLTETAGTSWIALSTRLAFLDEQPGDLRPTGT